MIAGILWYQVRILSMDPVAPYPSSELIVDVVFYDPSVRVEAVGSDNWPVTQAADGDLYTTWGDGGGFGGTNTRGRVSLGIAKVVGGKDEYSGHNIAGGVAAQAPSPFSGKSEGILAVDSVLYLWRNGSRSGKSAFEFSRLYRSDDAGVSWQFTGVEFGNESGDRNAGDHGFFSPTFCQFGPGYSGARDEYVYLYAPEIIDTTHWDVQRPGKIALLRVPITEIEDDSAYEFFAGIGPDGTPHWTDQLSQRHPVWEDLKNGTHRMAVSYNRGLGRYLLTTMTVSRDGWISIYEAPEPWGPWSTVLIERNRARWGSNVIAYHFVNKWLSSDGTEFVMVYTRDDAWASIEGRFRLTTESE